MTTDKEPLASGRPRWPMIRRWVRPLHACLSLAWLSVLLLFALTGFALNHDDWFGLAETEEATVTGRLPAPLCKTPDPDAIVGMLRDRYGVAGSLQAFETDDDELRAFFDRPGRKTDVLIDRRDGRLEVTTVTGNGWSMLAALHTGEQAGPLAGWLIDINAVALVLIALTGAVVWLDTPRRRGLGAAFLVAGTTLVGALMLYLLA